MILKGLGIKLHGPLAIAAKQTVFFHILPLGLCRGFQILRAWTNRSGGNVLQNSGAECSTLRPALSKAAAYSLVCLKSEIIAVPPLRKTRTISIHPFRLPSAL